MNSCNIKDLANISVRQQYYHLGYIIVKNVLPSSITDNLLANIKKNINTCSREVGCTEDEYLSAISRWTSPSQITDNLVKSIKQPIATVINNILNCHVEIKECSVISKNSFSVGAIPYHQDISYAGNLPYQATAWIALNDISKNSGPLEIVPKSHRGKIYPAADFWSPNYCFQKGNGIKIILSKGDLVLFDSRVIHGSSENISLDERYAVVIRWSADNYIPPKDLPEPHIAEFGMWTCGKITKKILSTGYKAIFGINSHGFIELLDAWVQAVEQDSLPFKVMREQVIMNLKKVKILTLGAKLHNGGDGAGTHYKNLWNSFLQPLNIYLQDLNSSNHKSEDIVRL